MFVNGKTLLEAAPIHDMAKSKLKFEGTSYGLSEAGYDIRIKQSVSFIDDNLGRRIVVSDGEKESIFRNEKFVLASSIERFEMPNNLVATVKDKSTWARRGLSVFNTVIEPGWKGYLTLELVFHGTGTVNIPAGSGIAQVLFSPLTDEGDYGEGKYQDQEDRPVSARNS